MSTRPKCSHRERPPSVSLLHRDHYEGLVSTRLKCRFSWPLLILDVERRRRSEEDSSLHPTQSNRHNTAHCSFETLETLRRFDFGYKVNTFQSTWRGPRSLTREGGPGSPRSPRTTPSGTPVDGTPSSNVSLSRTDPDSRRGSRATGLGVLYRPWSLSPMGNKWTEGKSCSAWSRVGRD